ncbi:MAG: TIGR04282 family arsenosugar biosynthesis glycosyltransferase [Acidiferrobacterales bacterium]
MKSPDLMLFAKQPVPGQVKTRLQEVYTPTQVAEIAAFLIRATVELAAASWPSDVYIYGAPNSDHPLFRDLAETFHLRLAAQVEGDLGHKMLCAMRDGIRRSGAAGIIGCDVPHCPWEVVEGAHEYLAKGQNVLGRTEDGGYYFIGMQNAYRRLFEEIEWGGNDVADVTLARARELGIAFEMLPTLRDIDTGESLWLAAHEFEPLRLHLYKVLVG